MVVVQVLLNDKVIDEFEVDGDPDSNEFWEKVDEIVLSAWEYEVEECDGEYEPDSGNVCYNYNILVYYGRQKIFVGQSYCVEVCSDEEIEEIARDVLFDNLEFLIKE